MPGDRSLTAKAMLQAVSVAHRIFLAQKAIKIMPRAVTRRPISAISLGDPPTRQAVPGIRQTDRATLSPRTHQVVTLQGDQRIHKVFQNIHMTVSVIFPVIPSTHKEATLLPASIIDLVGI